MVVLVHLNIEKVTIDRNQNKKDQFYTDKYLNEILCAWEKYKKKYQKKLLWVTRPCTINIANEQIEIADRNIDLVKKCLAI